MADASIIREHRIKGEERFTKNPELGQRTSVTQAVVTDGYRCEITDGKWKLVADLPEAVKGGNEGPAPGVFGRGALASCVAMGVVGWAARMEVPLDSVAVTVEADWDSRGDLGVDDSVCPGYGAVRVNVNISSPAPAEEIRSMLDKAEKYSPYLDVFRRSNDVSVVLAIAEVGTGT